MIKFKTGKEVILYPMERGSSSAVLAEIISVLKSSVVFSVNRSELVLYMKNSNGYTVMVSANNEPYMVFDGYEEMDGYIEKKKLAGRLFASLPTKNSWFSLSLDKLKGIEAILANREKQ